MTVLTPDKAGPKQSPATHQVRWFEWAGRSKPLVDFSLTSPADVVAILSLLTAGTRALKQLIAEERIDQCLALWAIPAGYLARRACGTSVPYSVWSLGSDIHTWARRPIAGSIVRRVLRGAEHRFADGLALSDEVRRISGRDCDFMPSTRRLPSAAPVERPNGKFAFLFVGRLEAVKGADVIVEAMLHVLSLGIDATLTMCGTGSMEESLRRRIEEGGATERIALLGSRPADVVAGYMAKCDCLVIPSRMESIPIVFSEALQAGIAMLVTDVGDMGELARRHGLAPPVAPANVDALASAMGDFCEHVDERKASYHSARQELLPVFDLDAIAGRFLATTGAA